MSRKYGVYEQSNGWYVIRADLLLTISGPHTEEEARAIARRMNREEQAA